MADSILVGEVAVAVSPDAEGFDDKIREQIVPSAASIGEQWGMRFTEAINAQIGDMMAKWSEETTDEAETGAAEAGDVYGKTFKDSAEEQLADGIKTEAVVSTTEATSDIDKLSAQMAELRAEAEKPIVIKTVAEGGAAAEEAAAAEASGGSTSAVETGAEDAAGLVGGTALVEDAAKDGDDAAEGFGSRFSSKVKALFASGASGIGNITTNLSEKMGEAGEDAGKEFGGKFGGTLTSSLGNLPLIGGALAVVAGGIGIAAIAGEKLENAIIPLQGVMDNLGLSYAKNSTEITNWGNSMAKYGVTTSTAESSLTKLLPLTKNLQMAQALAGDAANYAAAKNVDYSTALAFVAKAAQNPTRAFKQLGDTVATGSTQTGAMIKAQTDLADQIQSAGGIADFATQHNLSLAAAQKLVKEATNGTAGEVEKLNGKNVALSSIVSDVTGVMEGNSTAVSTLKGLHLSLAEAEDLVTKATGGSSAALSKLGIEVLPSDATAAQKAAIAHQALNAEFSGIAATKAQTFGGEMEHIKATFEDLFEAIGMKVLPPLEKFGIWLGSHVQILEVVAVTIGIVAAAFLVLAAATFVVTYAMTFGIGLAIAALILLFVKFHKQIVDGLLEAWNDVKNGVITAWDFIVNLFRKYWVEILLVFSGPIGMIIALVLVFHKQILNAIVDLMDLVKTAWGDGWTFVKNLAIEIWGDIRTEFVSSVDAYVDTWESFWNDIKTVAAGAFSWLQTSFTKFWGWMSTGWDTAVAAFKSIWSQIQSDAEAPVKFIVNTVYNDGIVPVVDAISGVIGKKALSKVSFATGGVVPGHSFTDNVHGVSVRGGEGILVPEAVAAIGGPEAVYALNRSVGYEPTLGFSPKTAFSDGGVWGDVTGLAGDAVSGIKSAAKDVISTTEGVSKDIRSTLRSLAGEALGAAINGIVNPLLNDIPGTDTPIGELVKQDIVHMENEFVSWVEGATQSSASGGGYAGAGSANIRSDITAILKTLGLSPNLLTNWMTQVQTESGGNLRAVNNWDVNAKEGHPSVGLVQVIGPTFDSYAGPYRNVGPFLDGVSINAMANLYAGINYAKNAYGANMANVIGQGHGYANGTMGAQRGWAWVGERGPELAYFHGGEQVYSHEQSMAAIKAMPGIRGGYALGTNPNITSEDLAQSGTASMKVALQGVESQLGTLIKVTKGVGGDTASALNSTSRGAGNRGAFNTRGY